MKTVKVRMGGGERYAILLDGDGLPLPYPNLFLTIHYRNASQSSNTCQIVLEQLRYLFEILLFLKIDLVDRCIKGSFLSDSELESIVKWAGFSVKEFRHHVEKFKVKRITSIRSSAVRFEFARAAIYVEPKGSVCNETAYNRLTTFAEYVEWLEVYLNPSLKSTSGERLRFMRSRRFQSSNNKDFVEYKSFTKEKMVKIKDVVRPDSPDNPWKNDAVKYRNQLIVSILEATGCRRGELLRMQVGDIKTLASGVKSILIRQSTDSDDERLDRPEAKTRGRYVPILSRLAMLCDDYIIEYRSTAVGSRKNPYLFVTHKEKKGVVSALSISSIDKIFRELSRSVGFNVHPHAFRHYWNDRFSEEADKRIAENRASEAKTESDRQKLMGWAPGSKMAMHYSKRHDEARAIEVGLALQKGMDRNF